MLRHTRVRGRGRRELLTQCSGADTTAKSYRFFPSDDDRSKRVRNVDPAATAVGKEPMKSEYDAAGQ